MRPRPVGAGRIGRAATAILGAVMALALTVGVASADPPGNNGTVKVNGTDIDDGTANQPHQGCTFQIQFFGYDEGAGLFADWSLDAQAPTAGGQLASSPMPVFIGEDAAGGANDLDATADVYLTGIVSGEAHVKLTVHADGSQGADVKHKTFWVMCEDGGTTGGGDDGGGTT